MSIGVAQSMQFIAFVFALQLTSLLSAEKLQFVTDTSLQPPDSAQLPTWVTGHTLQILGVMGALILAMTAWVFVLRSRVRKQAGVVRERIAKEGVLEERYRALVHDAHDFIYTHDLEGNITSINKTGEAITGYRSDAPVRPNFFTFVASEHHEILRRNLQALAKGESPPRFELPLLAEGGRSVILEIGLRAVYQEGRAMEVQGIGRDITERKQSEAQRLTMERNLQESQKLESLGLMAGGIAHDFNNLLTAILGNASLARTESGSNLSAQSYLSEIEKTSLQAAELCNQMLAYSGMGHFEVVPMDLSALIEEMRHLLQISVHKKISVHFDLAKNLSPVDADITQMRQVILNLVINASDAIGDQSGGIRIVTGSMRIDQTSLLRDFVTQTPPLGWYDYLEVTDTGCGMSAEIKAKIFDPFFTTKDTGRGLGLSAVLGIIRGHKGALKVSSELGRGSTFTLLLPCASDSFVVENTSEPTSTDWRGSGTILVVDDEAQVRRVVARMLQSFGFKVMQAQDGLDGVETFQAHADEIKLVLLDMTMPRMHGQEAFVRIKEIRPDARVIVMSGYTEQESANRLSREHPASFLQKPFKQNDLREALRAIIEGGEERR
jgi:PAS domain S-box-containing protein